jgi:hypothetical protein
MQRNLLLLWQKPTSCRSQPNAGITHNKRLKFVLLCSTPFTSNLFPRAYLEVRSVSFGWAALEMSTITPKLQRELLLRSTY